VRSNVRMGIVTATFAPFARPGAPAIGSIFRDGGGFYWRTLLWLVSILQLSFGQAHNLFDS
jgi:hypothetical protein